jgi:hypothetical protein
VSASVRDYHQHKITFLATTAAAALARCKQNEFIAIKQDESVCVCMSACMCDKFVRWRTLERERETKPLKRGSRQAASAHSPRYKLLALSNVN